MVDPTIRDLLEKQMTNLEENLHDRLNSTERRMGDRLTSQDKDMAAQNRVLGRIEEKVDKTNGRVTKLELWRARDEGLREAFHWVPALLSGLLCTAVTVAVTLLITHG